MQEIHVRVLVRSDTVVAVLEVSDATTNEVGVEVTVVDAGSGVDVAVSVTSG